MANYSVLQEFVIIVKKKTTLSYTKVVVGALSTFFSYSMMSDSTVNENIPLNEWVEWVIHCFCPSVHTGHSFFTFSFWYLLCSVCCSTSSPPFSLSVYLCSFPDSVSIATRAKLVLCTSAGILKLHQGNVVKKNRSATPSLLLPQNWTISAKTVVLTALVAALKAWHTAARKLFCK